MLLIRKTNTLEITFQGCLFIFEEYFFLGENVWETEMN